MHRERCPLMVVRVRCFHPVPADRTRRADALCAPRALEALGWSNWVSGWPRSYAKGAGRLVLASSCGEPESPATGFGFSGATRRPGPTADFVHDRWAFQASWGVVCAIFHSVMRQDRFLQMSAVSPLCVVAACKRSTDVLLQRPHPHAPDHISIAQTH